MAIPAFSAIGTFGGNSAGSNDSISPAYPSSVNANDIAICHAISENAPTISFPAGWNKVAEVAVSTDVTAAWAWRRCDGSEDSATIEVTRTDVDGVFWAGIATFSGCLTSDTPYEQAASDSANSRYMTSSEITTQGADRLVVALLGEEDNMPVNAAPGGSWTERWAQLTDIYSDGGLWGYSYDVATAATISAAEWDIVLGKNWVTFTFALLPAASGSALPIILQQMM